MASSAATGLPLYFSTNGPSTWASACNASTTCCGFSAWPTPKMRRPSAASDSPNVPPAVLAGLRALKVQGVSPDAPVFTNRAGVAWTNIQIQHRWRRVLSKAGVRYRSPEQLRHTFASTLLSRNAPLLYVQQQGGWKSAGVLLRVYARWMPQDLAPSVTPVAPEVQRVAEPRGQIER